MLLSTGSGTNKAENVFLTHGLKNGVNCTCVEGVLQSLDLSEYISFHLPGLTCPVPTHPNRMFLCKLIKVSERLMLSFPFNSV